MYWKSLLIVVATQLFAASAAQAVPIVISTAGPTQASIQASVNIYRLLLGDLNPNVAGSFGTGRREINWDGVPDAFSAPNGLPGDFFNVNSPRGTVFSTPGTGFALSADDSNPAATPPEFADIDPSYAGSFATFSPQRLFTPLGSTITDVHFFVPGSTQTGTTTGFGAVFTDVDVAGSTTMEFFDPWNHSLGTFNVPAFAGDGTLSFLGVQFTDELIGRVRITSGNQALGPGNVADDVVAMDDFIYAEPVAAVPEPLSVGLLGAGLALLGYMRSRNSQRRTPRR